MEAAMVARTAGGALLIAIIAAIIVSLVSLAMLLREPVYKPAARVWVVRELSVGTPAPGPNSILTETTPAMVRLAASRPVARGTRRSLGLQASSAELLENLEIRRVPGTTFIDLTYRGTDRKKATQTVNTLARVSSERLGWQSWVGDSSSEREITVSTPSTQPTWQEWRYGPSQFPRCTMQSSGSEGQKPTRRRK